MIVHEAKLKEWADMAKTAGLAEEEWKPMAKMIWKMKIARAVEEQKSMMVSLTIKMWFLRRFH